MNLFLIKNKWINVTVASFQFTCIRIFTLYPSALLQLEALCGGPSSCLPPPIIWGHWYKCWMFKIPVVKLHKISHFRNQSPEFSNSVTFGVMLKLSVFVQMKGVIYGSVRRRRAFHYRLQTARLCFESQRWPSLLQRSTWMAATRLNLYLWFFLKSAPTSYMLSCICCHPLNWALDHFTSRMKVELKKRQVGLASLFQ